MKRLFITSTLCLSVVCVSPELKEGLATTAKYHKQYVEYANKKIKESGGARAEEMAGIGKKLTKRVQQLDELINGKLRAD